MRVPLVLVLMTIQSARGVNAVRSQNHEAVNKTIAIFGFSTYEYVKRMQQSCKTPVTHMK